MKKNISLFCALLIFASFLFGCAAAAPSPDNSSQREESSRTQSGEENSKSAEMTDERQAELAALARELTGYMAAGDYEQAVLMMEKTMVKAIGGKPEDVWEPNIKSGGAFVETGAYIAAADSGYEIVEMTLVFENAKMIQRTVFDKENKVAGLFFRLGMIEEEELPEGVVEEEAVVEAADGFPLNAIISMPENGEIIAAVVLVHGSGPQDMDSTVGPNKPFMDIAHGLAKHGIAVLRYDKRTYSHGAQMASEKIGINEETADDAAAAVELLKQHEGIDPDKVYIFGHSMAGGLLAYINSRGASCAGYIIAAGTPRSIWELSAEQNLLAGEEMEDENDRRQVEDFVKAEREKAAVLKTISAEEAAESDETIFGMPIWYLRSFEDADAIALHMADKKPVFVIQGQEDRQVGKTDFELWKAGLESHPAASFKLYPGLNHLLGEYKGEPVPFMELVEVEYMAKIPVSQQLIDDIARWIKNGA